MGSQLKTEELAYIAGFLDGDGSLMLQIKKRRDSNNGWRFMFTICFYQDTRHEKPLLWIKKKLEIGYISRRNDGITELRINGYEQSRRVLKMLLPYIRFKKIQAVEILKAARILYKRNISGLHFSQKSMLKDIILRIQKENYQSRAKRSSKELSKVLGLTP